LKGLNNPIILSNVVVFSDIPSVIKHLGIALISFHQVKTIGDPNGVGDLPVILKGVFVPAVGRYPTDERIQVIGIAHQDLPALGLQTLQLTGFLKATGQ
jgi:hypothetical protein